MALLREAEALWRGPAFADIDDGDLAATRAGLEERRLQAVETRVDMELALGRHADVLAELEQLTRIHPLRERMHMQLLTALYRNGRHTDAAEAALASMRPRCGCRA